MHKSQIKSLFLLLAKVSEYPVFLILENLEIFITNSVTVMIYINIKLY